MLGIFKGKKKEKGSDALIQGALYQQQTQQITPYAPNYYDYYQNNSQQIDQNQYYSQENPVQSQVQDAYQVPQADAYQPMQEVQQAYQQEQVTQLPVYQEQSIQPAYQEQLTQQVYQEQPIYQEQQMQQAQPVYQQEQSQYAAGYSYPNQAETQYNPLQQENRPNTYQEAQNTWALSLAPITQHEQQAQQSQGNSGYIQDESASMSTNNSSNHSSGGFSLGGLISTIFKPAYLMVALFFILMSFSVVLGSELFLSGGALSGSVQGANTSDRAAIQSSVEAKVEIKSKQAPQIYEVGDIEDAKQRNPRFYRDLQEGDYLLLYPDQAVLYRPGSDKIVAALSN